MAKKYKKSDLLFHFVHGLCRVAEVPKAGAEDQCYALVPVFRSRSNARFTIPHDALESSGFNKLVSSREAAQIFDFFKTGEKKKSAKGHAWEIAVFLREESINPEPCRDKRKALKMNQSAKRLSNELAIVLQSTSREIADKIQENLETVSKINPAVLAALSNADSI